MRYPWLCIVVACVVVAVTVPVAYGQDAQDGPSRKQEADPGTLSIQIEKGIVLEFKVVPLKLKPFGGHDDLLVSVGPITNAQYAPAVAAKAAEAPLIPAGVEGGAVRILRPPENWRKRIAWEQGRYPEGEADSAVLFVTHEQASDYCKWLTNQHPRYRFRLLNGMEWPLDIMAVPSEESAKLQTANLGDYFLPRPASGPRAMRNKAGLWLAPFTCELLGVDGLQSVISPRSLKRMRVGVGYLTDPGKPFTRRLERNTFVEVPRAYGAVIWPTVFRVVALPVPQTSVNHNAGQ